MNSVDYYNAHAKAYFAGTVNADVSLLRHRFLTHVPARGRILDAGCGSGRDAKAFAEAGYAVCAFDASEGMVELAREHTGLDIQLLQFADMAWQADFDGIWASASLLHVARADLPGVFARFAAALRSGGAWYLSLKHGETTRELDGRSFTDVTEEEVVTLVAAVGLEVVEVWFSDDVRPGRADRWVNLIARAPAT